MHSERLRKAEAAFHALVDLAPEQRARTITDLCGDDKELRVFVERLLASHDSEAAAVLRTPVYGAPAVGRHRVKADAPERIGRYKIIRLLGQGGMGVVYLAEQTEPLRRQVALKLIKVGMDTRQVIARFEAERQTLAMMNHPNVAGVFDAGVTEDDRPFFVMEYVPGLMITGYCDVNGLTVPERLGLFLKVCDGIQHAHQKGVIHRDLKPGNILVDEQGRPKILDFGVARLTNSDVQAVTMQTAVGQLVGTIPYMSPEQVTGVSANVDTRSDVYALGMICYKLLTGNLPYDIQDRSIPEAVRIIREEEPTRLSSVDTHFRGDLDTIIIKALQKDKARRYQSASELAADLRNYLENRPIAARPPTTFYQLRMFARRNKPLVGGVLATFMALLIGIAGIAVQATRVTRERDNARQAERLADTRRDLAERRAYAAHIAAAQAALRANDVVIARQRLDAASPDLRNWEWRYMASRLDASSATLASHDRYVWSVTYGPDGSWLASGSTDETVKLWDIASGHVVQTMSAGARVQGVSVSPDGRRVVAATENGLLQVWSSSSGDKLMTMSDHTEAVSDAAFSPNGRLIASAACDATVRIWDADTGECRLVLEHPSWVHDVCFTSDSTRLATSCRDNVARLWDLSTHLPVAEIQVLPSSADWDFVHSWAVAVDPNGQVLATGAHDGVIKLWSVATGGLLEVLEGHTSRVRSLEFSSDAARLASGSDDCTVRLWNPSTGIGLATLLGHEGAVFSVGFSPDSKRLASASADHTVRIWDARGSSQLNRIWGHGNLGIPALAISPDGTQIISGGVDGVVQLWETESQTPTAVIHGHQGKVYAVTFSPDGEYAASGARDGTVRIWETAGGTEFGTLIGHEGAVTAVVFLSHATRLASAAKDGTIKVWDSASHAEVMTMRSETEQFTALACSPDARQLVSGSSTGFIEFWDAEAGRRLNAVHGHQGEVTSVNYSPDGTRFVTASSDRTLRMWCPRTAVSTTMLQGHTDLVADAAFSPDGTRVASVSRDRMLRLWDPDTGETVLSFKAHQDWPASVAFSPDGAWLVSSGKSIRIWKATKPARQIIE